VPRVQTVAAIHRGYGTDILSAVQTGAAVVPGRHGAGSTSNTLHGLTAVGRVQNEGALTCASDWSMQPVALGGAPQAALVHPTRECKLTSKR